MAGAQPDDGSKGQRLKAALWYSVGQVIDEISLAQGINASPHFIAGLSELLWSQIDGVAHDLEAFAKHAGRSVINTDDVMLLARRNEGLANLLRTRLKQIDITGT